MLDIEKAVIECLLTEKKLLNQLNGLSHYLKSKSISSNCW